MSEPDWKATPSGAVECAIGLNIDSGGAQEVYRIPDELGLSQTSISKYARLGKEAPERRKQQKEAREPEGDQQPGEDPLRSGEPLPMRGKTVCKWCNGEYERHCPLHEEGAQVHQCRTAA
ncbi:hypothetical protein ABZ782_03280 [Streptomyces asoensis]|uniref:hypothetical protein n=1 Tax=Streptomyces asoensis TaxID=249586 RepID=UPI003400A2D3